MGNDQAKITEFHLSILRGQVDEVKKFCLEDPKTFVNSDPGADNEEMKKAGIVTSHPLQTCVQGRALYGYHFLSVSQFEKTALKGESNDQYQIASYLIENFASNYKKDGGAVVALDEKVNARNDQKTSFHLAAERFDLGMIKLFFKHNFPSTSHRCSGGLTPLNLLCQEAGKVQKEDLLSIIEHCGLQKHDFNPHPVKYNVDSRTRLIHQCITEFVVEANDFPRSFGTDQKELAPLCSSIGYFPLHYLAQGGYYEAIGEFITAGFPTNFKVKDASPVTPALELLRTVKSLMIKIVPLFDEHLTFMVYWSIPEDQDKSDPRHSATMFAFKRYLQTLRVLMSNEKFDSEEEKQKVRADYVKEVMSWTALFYRKKTLTREEIEQVEPFGLLHELLVNFKCPLKGSDDVPLYAPFLESTVGEKNATLLFGEDGFYTTKLANKR